MLPEVGEIKRRRKALGLTQGELADKANISRTSLVKLELGDADLRYSKVKEIFDTLEYLEGVRSSGSPFQGTLGDIHNQSIAFVLVDDSLRSVSSKMIQTSYSQFPVKDGETIVGSITEMGINKAIDDRGKDAIDLRVSEILEEPFPVISVNVPVSAVRVLLRKVQAILTIDKGFIVGIVTNQDLYKKLV